MNRTHVYLSLAAALGAIALIAGNDGVARVVGVPPEKQTPPSPVMPDPKPRMPVVVVPVAPQPQPQPQQRANCRGYTWSSHKTEGELVHVGADPQVSEGYRGDTDCSVPLPILCVSPQGLPSPAGLELDYYHGWVGGSLALSAPVQGFELTSRSRADQLCAESLGAGYRMAEHHDGGGGWGYAGYGAIETGQRFWVAINDQRANPWDSR